MSYLENFLGGIILYEVVRIPISLIYSYIPILGTVSSVIIFSTVIFSTIEAINDYAVNGYRKTALMVSTFGGGAAAYYFHSL